MKKSIFYLALATITGLLGGYVIFGDNSDISNKETSENHKHTQGTENEMWTCSMHPQIMKTEAGDCPICGMDLIPAASSAEGLAANEIKMTNNAMALANIQTSFVGVGTSKGGETTVSLSGNGGARR
jgi:Cu(I)/Ag(I) efflux system membrane fusion protein